MPLSVYNTLTRKKEPFVPQKADTVSMYSCGVTVYDDCHIGHARSLYIFDVIRRYLRYRGYDVLFVRNITDIDDKIINKAQQEHASAQAVAEKNIRSYYEDLKTLGIEQADIEPKATGHIPEMIAHIQGLIEKGFAYVADGDVYFRVKQFKEYGKLSGQSIEAMRESGRIESDPKKEDPLDFALWKKAKPGEPEYESPWSKGRPGWHIECSAMSAKYLGQTFDIHAGGMDLVFPHHENEIAQSEALTGKTFARYWIHHGLLTINSQKMAKSLGNFITIKDFIKRYHNINFLKLIFLSTHYSHAVDFNEQKIEEARKQYERIDTLLNKIETMYGVEDVSKIVTGATGFIQFKEKFIEYMDDDFNMPRALSILFDLISECNKLLESSDAMKQFKLRYAMDIMSEMVGIFGLSFAKDITGKISKEEVEKAIAKRIQLKKEKQYAAADAIRKELIEKDIILEDSKEGTTWRRKV